MRLAENELHLALKVKVERLTINGLLRRFEALEREVFAELLDAAQRQHLRAVRRGEAPAIRCPRCGGTSWVKRGSRDRQLTTSQGELVFPLRQVTCRSCDRTWSPFVERLGLQPRQRTSEELREKVVGFVTETSYRKASRFGEESFGTTLSAMEIWRTVQRRGPEVELTPDEELPAWMETDGTGVPAGEHKRGEPAVLALQVGARTSDGGRRRRKRLVGLGVGDWAEALPGGLDPGLVVHDGGHAVHGAVAGTYPEARSQRCEWHLPHSLDFALWNDDVELERRRRLQEELRGLIFGPERSRSRRTQIREWARWRLAEHPRGAALLEGAADEVCYPISSPLRTTSHAERAMREMNRRVDVGARWSETGLENLLRLRCSRRLNPDDYARVWNTHENSLTVEARSPAPTM